MDPVSSQKRLVFFLLTVTFFLALNHASAFALIQVAQGEDEPIRDEGWSKGAVEFANLPSRFRWFAVSGYGDHHFEYRGHTKAFLDALKSFAEIQAPQKELVIQDWPAKPHWNAFGGGEDVDWRFTIWNPKAYHDRFTNPDRPKGTWVATYLAIDGGPDRVEDIHLFPLSPNKPAPPRITVYIGEGGRIDWTRVLVPAGIEVIDERAEAQPIISREGGVFVGSVYDMGTGKPVVGASVSLVEVYKEPDLETIPRAATDKDGRFALEGVPEGSFNVLVSADGYVQRSTGRFRSEAKTSEERVVYLAEAATVTGVVIDFDGNPVAGAQVHAFRTTGFDGEIYSVANEIEPVVTGEEGRFQFAGLPKGYVYLQCRGDWFTNSNFEPFPAPARNIHLMAVPTGSVRGRLVDSKARLVSGEFMVTIVAWGRRVGRARGRSVSADDGTFELDGIPPGEYYLEGSDRGAHDREATTQRFFLKPGEVVEMDMVMDP